MTRDRSRFVADRPGCAVLRTPLRTVVSTPIISENARIIRSVYVTPAASTITVKTVGKHGWTVLDTISVRVGGWNGLTYRAHPANGDNWPITIVDDYTVTLTGSTFVTNSLFLHGIAYTGSLTIDAVVELQRLVLIAEEDGGLSTLDMPPGLAAFLSKSGPTHMLGMRSSVAIRGADKNASYIFAGDNTNGHILFYYEVEKVTVSDITIMGNRPYQGTGGYHGIRFAGLEGNVITQVTITDVNLFGIAGYGIGDQGDGSFTEEHYTRVTICETDSDGRDGKNRTNLTKNNSAHGCNIFHTMLFVQGVNAVGELLGSNPITTNSGTPTLIAVAHSGNVSAVGVTVTLEDGSDSANANGLTFPITGVITARNASAYTLDISVSGQSATSSGAMGGSAVTAFISMFSRGDAAFDTRGGYWNISAMHLRGDFDARAAIRARKGHSYAPGSGTRKSTITGVTIEHTGPIPQQGNGIAVMDEDVVITGVVGYNLFSVLNYASNVKGGTNTGVIGHSCAYVIYNDAENISSTGFIGNDSTGATVYDDGGLAEDSGDMETDAFTTTAGSNLVTVSMPLHARITGNTVTYAGVALFDNVDMNGSFVVTVIDANTVRVTASTNATAGMSGGGENATFEWSGAAHLARLNSYIGGKSIASVVGYQFTSKSRDALVMGCSSYQDTTPYSDAAPRTKFKHNTGDLPNREEIVSLPLDGTPLYLTTADAGKLYYLPTTATATAVVYLPIGTANNLGIKYSFANGSGTYGIEVRLQGTGNIRIGSTTSSVGLSCAAGGDSLEVIFREVTQQRWMALSHIGTWPAL